MSGKWIRDFVHGGEKENPVKIKEKVIKKKGRGKSDNVNYETFRLGKYKGRPGKERGILKHAQAIIDGETIAIWEEKYGFTEQEYKEFRSALIDFDFRYCFQTSKDADPFQFTCRYFKEYSARAVKAMCAEIDYLRMTLFYFERYVERAIKKGDKTFINVVRLVFKDDAGFYLGTVKEKTRGDNPRKDLLPDARFYFKEWLEGAIKYELPTTFSMREKPKGFCLLAHEIHELLFLHFEAIFREMWREDALIYKAQEEAKKKIAIDLIENCINAFNLLLKK